MDKTKIDQALTELAGGEVCNQCHERRPKSKFPIEGAFVCGYCLFAGCGTYHEDGSYTPMADEDVQKLGIRLLNPGIWRRET